VSSKKTSRRAGDVEQVRHIHTNRLGHVVGVGAGRRFVDWRDGQAPAWTPDQLLRDAGGEDVPTSGRRRRGHARAASSPDAGDQTNLGI